MKKIIPTRFLALLIFATASSQLALASDVRSIPGGMQGNEPLHVDGTEDGGRPIIHRPSDNPANAVRNGVGSLLGGAEDPTITYTGRAQGTHGGRRSPIVIDVDEGRPVLRY
jgi:hypothetical protein